MAAAETGAPHGHLPARILENHPRVGRRDLSTEEAIDASVISLVIGPLSQFLGIRFMPERESTLLGEKPEQDADRGIALGQLRSLQGRVDGGLPPGPAQYCAGFCHLVNEFAGEAATFQVQNASE